MPDRLDAWNARMAPLQVAWLEVLGTTAWPGMDCRIVDAVADPVDSASQHYTETLVHLPRCMVAWEPQAALQRSLSSLPAQRNGFVTFGCVANPVKLSPTSLDLFSKVLRAVPGSRLAMCRADYANEQVAGAVRQRLASHGIQAERVEFQHGATSAQHAAFFDGIDVSLDTTPYGAVTTAFLDALSSTTIEPHAANVATTKLTMLGGFRLAR
jgi:predicted O-linked N-acetylglucosamine transferase (SPINDLY family)